MSDRENKREELFFPYYVNQGRLIDIYAILNNGYSEYSEITTAIGDEKTKKGEMNISANSGFKIFNFGGSALAEREKTDSKMHENKEKKVQTVTSVLSIVKSWLTKNGYLHDIEGSKPGQFVCLPVVLKINSIKSLLSEMADLLKLSANMQKSGIPVKGLGKNSNDLNNLIKQFKFYLVERKYFMKQISLQL